MPVALIAAGVAAAGSIGGALISSGASNHASDIAQNTANQNNATQTAIYGSNKANLAPFTDRGNAAGNEYNALLGLGGQQQQQQQPQAPPAGYGGNAFGAYNGDYTNGQGYGAGRGQYTNPVASAGWVAPSQDAHTAATNAFNTFTNSDGYKFRVGQGINAVDTGAASRGALDSGAAVKAEQTYGQGMASDEFGKYMGYLGNQQSVGLAAANGLAGVGTAYANATSSNNNNAAGAAGSAAYNSAAAINQGIGGVANAFGKFASSGSSYGGFSGSPSLVNQTTGMLNNEGWGT
jgi:hypothetical protein